MRVEIVAKCNSERAVTVGALRALLEKAREDEEVVLCVNRCEEVRGALCGGEWVVVSGYFAVGRVRVGEGAVVLYADGDAG